MQLYEQTEPHDEGMLDVGDDNRVHWQVTGNPDGKPAVLLHGGPGSGSSPGFRRYFDPSVYRLVQFDQRGCGRSTPNAADPTVSLRENTTHHLLADMEQLREHLGIDRWLVFGVSWGTTLGLAYAEQHPDRVSEVILLSVGTTTRREVEWITRDVGRFFPEEWTRLRDGVPPEDREGSLVHAYSRLLHDPDPVVREQAAKDWCAWEDSHVVTGPDHRPDPRYEDPAFRMVFARLVTHYWRHEAWLPDGALIVDASRLTGIPGVLIHGRQDLSSPPDIAWQVAQNWPDAELILIHGAGHGAREGATQEALFAAAERFADRPSSG